MDKRLVIICLPLAVLHTHAYAQFTDPRTYQNTPVGINQLELAYANARSNTSIDTSFIVSGAKFNLNQGLIDYTRYFAFLHRMAWVEASVPIANLSGFITGTDITGSTTGTGDSGYTAAILLKGGPALSPEQFANAVTTTSIGLSLSTTAPTGEYDPNKLLNLGSDRWSFKPELAISKPFGPEQRWVFDAYANTYLYTDNTSYRGAEVLRQRALLGLEGHISYTFNNTVWASLDTRYSFRGDTIVSSVNQDNPQRNFILRHRTCRLPKLPKLVHLRIRQSGHPQKRPIPQRLHREVRLHLGKGLQIKGQSLGIARAELLAPAGSPHRDDDATAKPVNGKLVASLA